MCHWLIEGSCSSPLVLSCHTVPYCIAVSLFMLRFQDLGLPTGLSMPAMVRNHGVLNIILAFHFLCWDWISLLTDHSNRVSPCTDWALTSVTFVLEIQWFWPVADTVWSSMLHVLGQLPDKLVPKSYRWGIFTAAQSVTDLDPCSWSLLHWS